VTMLNVFRSVQKRFPGVDITGRGKPFERDRIRESLVSGRLEDVRKVMALGKHASSADPSVQPINFRVLDWNSPCSEVFKEAFRVKACNTKYIHRDSRALSAASTAPCLLLFSNQVVLKT
jgi:hypothetical protein